MSPFQIIIILSVSLGLAMLVGGWHWLQKRRVTRRIHSINEELLAASRDASVGRRLSIPNDPESAQLSHTVNRLFDALGERDEKIQGRDRLFKDFAQSLPWQFAAFGRIQQNSVEKQ